MTSILPIAESTIHKEELYLLERVRYVHLNPLRGAGLRARIAWRLNRELGVSMAEIAVQLRASNVGDSKHDPGDQRESEK